MATATHRPRSKTPHPSQPKDTRVLSAERVGAEQPAPETKAAVVTPIGARAGTANPPHGPLKRKRRDKTATIMADLGVFMRTLRQTDGGRLVFAIFAGCIVVIIANMVGLVRLNTWNGQFFDAVGKKYMTGFVHYLWVFLEIIAVLQPIPHPPKEQTYSS